MSLRDTITPAQKLLLKSMKTVPEPVKVAVYDGCNNTGAASQFHTDVGLYGMYEALLYVESYEGNGYFVKGTAERAAEIIYARAENLEVRGYKGWPGDGSGEDDLADYNQMEADDYRDE